MENITVKIGGEAGFGIISAGTMLVRTFSRNKYHTFATNDYPSLIRGGHNVITVRIATTEFYAMNQGVHVLVALNRETVEFHKETLMDGSILVFDPHDHDWKSTDFPHKVELVSIPLRAMVAKFQTNPIMRNTIALGVVVALLGGQFEWLASVIRDQFKKKGDDVIAQNTTIAQAGYDYVKKQYLDSSSMALAVGKRTEEQLVLNGSEAVGLGSVRAGLKFAAIYPMTPINALITFLADHSEKLKLVYKQPEDEIAGINMAIGASIAGARSMVATSGGGFALMVEGLSLAGMLEVPLVIDMGMRPGPATGMPTYTEQGELQFIIHAGHGEFPRIVLAPGDALEAYQLTIDAFNLADRYHVPVFVLTDKYLNESVWCVPMSHFKKEVNIDRGQIMSGIPMKDGSFPRYDSSFKSGVSPRSFPGSKGGQYWANSYEHDEVGHMTDHALLRIQMVTKRMNKLKTIEEDAKPPTVYGDEEAEITFVSWGSCKGLILEAMQILSSRGKKTRLVHFNWLYPFPTKRVSELLSPVTRLIDVEQNATAQLASLIREHTGILIKERILKFDGRPFWPEEIVDKVS